MSERNLVTLYALAAETFLSEVMMEFIRLLIVFLVPPLAVYLQFGIDRHFWASCLLTVLGFVPGVLYSLYVMTARPPGLSRLSIA
ncbi:YqaE/Pmp3 family membrane protein [Neorhodopirellula pilleata]|uniref:YqaE/Pmp3 family membrane protein n=1 Tax=Neorhodopirellula pilleata TaxID=2714738 RepID=UPI001E5F18CA|nr:YqaE/Pmp3 family membrane protein [Neorhodopirellula pilleata]